VALTPPFPSPKTALQHPDRHTMTPPDDEEDIDQQLFRYQPNSGGYPDLHNHFVKLRGMREIVFVLVFGVLLGGAAAFLYMSKESEQTLKNIEGAESARADSRAMQAYQHEDPAIAIWELRHLADRQAEEVRKERTYTNEAKAALLMTRARLAKLYHEQGREREAQTNAQIAISMLSAFPGTNATVTNLPSLLERLRQTDTQAKQQPRYE
jgi:hypothetical protein